MSKDLFCRNSPCPCLNYPGCKIAQVEGKAASSRDPYCLCPSCLGTQIKDEECHMTKYNCNCDASAGAPDHARTCPQHRDFGKISGKDVVDAYESRGASIGTRQPKMVNSPQLDIYAAGAAACETGTSPQSPGRSYHPLVNIAEWRKGCSCAPKDFPVQCEQCTEGLIRAVENWFVQHRSAYPFDVPALLSDLDGLTRKYDLPELRFSAAKLIRTFEADLYAAQDQVAGLQDLMANPVDAPTSREAELHAALVKAQKVIDMLFPGVSKIFGVDFQELNESCAAVSQALKAKPTDVMKAEAALASPSIEVYALPEDLIVDLNRVPAGIANVAQAVTCLGIKWASWSTEDRSTQILLKACTDVPVVLPAWLEVKK